MITASEGAETQYLENGNRRGDTHGTAGPEMEVSALPSLEQGKQLRQPQSKVVLATVS